MTGHDGIFRASQCLKLVVAAPIKEDRGHSELGLELGVALGDVPDLRIGGAHEEAIRAMLPSARTTCGRDVLGKGNGKRRKCEGENRVCMNSRIQSCRLDYIF